MAQSVSKQYPCVVGELYKAPPPLLSPSLLLLCALPAPTQDYPKRPNCPGSVRVSFLAFIDEASQKRRLHLSFSHSLFLSPFLSPSLPFSHHHTLSINLCFTSSFTYLILLLSCFLSFYESLVLFLAFLKYRISLSFFISNSLSFYHRRIFPPTVPPGTIHL